MQTTVSGIAAPCLFSCLCHAEEQCPDEEGRHLPIRSFPRGVHPFGFRARSKNSNVVYEFVITKHDLHRLQLRRRRLLLVLTSIGLTTAHEASGSLGCNGTRTLG